MKLNLTVAALAAGASLLFAGTAAAEVTVTTGAGYVKMVQALVDAYQSQTQAKVGTAFGGNIGQMLAQVREGGKVCRSSPMNSKNSRPASNSATRL